MGPSPPRILITGMYRTGSTRLYNVLREALVKHCPEARCEHFGTADLLDEALATPGPGIFKEHTFSDSTAQRILNGDVQAVATVREPLATMISLCATFGWPAEKSVEETDVALRHLERIAAAARIYSYETAVSNNPATVYRLVDEAGLHPSWPQAVRLARRWTAGKARSISTTLITAKVGTYDRVTLLHPGHVAGERTVDEATLGLLCAGAAERDFDLRVGALEQRAT